MYGERRDFGSTAPVKVGDELSVRFGQKIMRVKIERLLETTKKEEASGLYSVLSEERVQEETE